MPVQLPRPSPVHQDRPFAGATRVSAPNNQPLTVNVEQDGDALVIRPSGELDIATIMVLDAALRKAMNGGASAVIVDLKGLTFIDSSGLRLLVIAADRSRCNGSRLRMLRGSAPVERMFEVTGMDHSLPFID
jgi:anti-sigma B factor antagonist